MKTTSASELEAKCLAILDEVAATGEIVTILEYGEPVARLTASSPSHDRYRQHDLVGTVTFLGDAVEPLLEPETWEALGER